MKITKIAFHSILILMLLTIHEGMAQNLDLSAKAIVQKADENMRGRTSITDISIQIIRPTWHREMNMKTWTKGDEYSMILLTSPAKEKGIAFLKRMKEVWNWIPAIERTIKLPPSMMSQSWMGTDFTNDDLVKEASSVADYDHKHLGSETIDGKDCYKIEMIPKPSAAIVWEKVIVWIDKQDFLQLKAEFYDEDGEMMNIMKASEIKVLGGRKITSKIEMIPIDKEGNSTVIIYNDIEFDKAISDDFFTTRNMKQLE
ncbi:outer membrane lipoprotein-sorting protein [Maribacter polysiphoniae]|uniref:Outer membrane lipoprotein-sorting protein n=1 Tax=Maribacter polysiphoniae TaxID=429344 RepID=A0A316E314_9FLAO|nr:outer membrane lipoprotein-sorting protein [Maribacter polysiphoniae]MBD1259755.1 outer membrane lipoprotein-sorting protein [Maribacter polysiphoniae]PWK23103.1 outer membrane lipoprotein-sorting protein [Maribacter polysiphoniae]